ncbi:MAG: bifunctional 4-hydroxy-2-oxoglutarate aldolase/2-dehydro-3-deoxy-phosphogluconate aldolase [Candidatus Omnitrophica bacterium]|nr:bifunctional 4-hydroxy-2-oxoglutarate aldolase/2-dehydro-3-deoxy-phosphogluconate aldolase [Candidatus Omnitrophota bacterium]
MKDSQIYERLSTAGVVPVVAIDNVKSAVPMADALLAGGLPVAEITFRTAAAAEVIQVLRRERPQMWVGAGTILTVENLKRAIEAGASFGVAPGLNPRVAKAAIEAGFPFSPGVMTPSEIEEALDMGLKVLKLFPAGAAGGVSYLKSVATPYAHTGVKFIPTGGITQANLKDYLELGLVLAAGGTWIATRDDIAAGRWDIIRDRCRSAGELVRQLRSKPA